MTLIGLGLVAGSLGGLLGIGGSIVMIPVLTLALGHDQHLSQASAMIVNVFVAAPAVLRHQRARAVEWTIVRRMLPAGLIAIVLGVEVSNHLDGAVLMRAFGVFLVYVIYVNVRKVLDRGGAANGHAIARGWTVVSIVGVITGFAAGLLGIGGGIIAVPLLQRLCHLPLRRAIACSAALMCITAVVGAIRKNLALAQIVTPDGLHLDSRESLLIAACLAPTAMLGGLIGAGLTHTMPLRWLRVAFILLMSFGCLKFLGVV